MADIASTIGWVAGAVGVFATAIAAVSSFRKTGGEKTGLLVDAATDIVVVQQGAMDRLQQRLDNAEKTIDSLRFIQSEIEALRLEVQRLTRELDRVTAENEKLRRELAAARKRIKQLEDHEV